MIELILGIIVFIAGLALLYLLYRKRKNERPDIQLQDKLTIDQLLTIVKQKLADVVKDEYFFGKDDVEWEEAYRRKRRIQMAMKNCVYGIDSDKIIVRDLIRDIISKELTDEEKIADLIDFNGSYLDPMVKWEVLLYILKKKYGKDAMPYLIKTYHWDKVRYDIEDGTVPTYGVSIDDLEFAYREEVTHKLTYFEQLDVLSIIIFSKYKGFGCIDTLREQNVDGINCGASGAILSAILDVENDMETAPRSVWIYYQGKYIHLRFLTFYTEEELRRVILLICMYNNPGPLTEKRGYMVNTMYDKSRVLAIRPGVSEYWGIFIRKFNISDVNLKKLYIKENDDLNAQLPITLIEYLMRSCVTCGFTGRQGAGKTTGMIGAVQYIDGRYNMRVMEMTPEMYLRERYPARNIFSVSETQYISAEELQDALKKSDSAISIVGEVATNKIAARMIQMGQVASVFTIFSHHANRTKDLVYSLRNSLVEAGGFNNMLTAEQQVVDVVRVDIHFDFDVTGFRYIDRITEIIKIDENLPYPEYDPKHPQDSMNKITKEYYYRQTDRSSFTTQDIVRFNKKTRQYEAVKWFSPELTTHMLKNIPTAYVAKFKTFVKENWRE